MLFDSHTHLNLSAFDKDRDEVIKRCQENGVLAINIGTCLETNQKAIVLAQKYPHQFWASVGIHPVHTFPFPADKDEMEKGDNIYEAEEVDQKFYQLAKQENVIAIGECGLDYSYLKNIEPKLVKEFQEKEIKTFKDQVLLAKELNKPLVIHVREEYEKALQIIKDIYPQAKGVFHFFCGNKKQAKEIIDAGFYLGFSGIITYTTNYDLMIKELPLERILIETDAPYVAPVPFRGQRNEPLYVKYVAEKIAKIKGLEVKEVINQSLRNSLILFNLNSYSLVDRSERGYNKNK